MTDSDSDHSAMSRDPRSAHGGRAASKGSKAGPKPNKYYPRTGKRGAPQAFPRKVFEILSEQPAEIISWTPSGLAFMIHDMPRFVSEVLQKYFAHQKFSSFQRQLNLYGYRRIEPGGDEPAGSFAHDSFRRDESELLSLVRRPKQAKPSASAARRARDDDSDDNPALANKRSRGRSRRGGTWSDGAAGDDDWSPAEAPAEDVEILRALASRAPAAAEACVVPLAPPPPPPPLGRALTSTGGRDLRMSVAIASDGWFDGPAVRLEGACTSASLARGEGMDGEGGRTGPEEALLLLNKSCGSSAAPDGAIPITTPRIAAGSPGA